jgi:hypothetical protein
MSQPFPTYPSPAGPSMPWPPVASPPPAPPRPRPWRTVVLVLIGFVVGVLVGSAGASSAPAPTRATEVPAAPSVSASAPTPERPSAASTAPATEAPAAVPAGTYPAGVYRLGHDIAPGDYVTDGPTGPVKLATWSRLSDTSGDAPPIAFGVVEGHTVMTVSASDAAVRFTGSATWRAA